MKKSALYCLIFSLLMLVGLAIGLFTDWSLRIVVLTILLLPAAIYEIIRTEGFFTTGTSILITLLLLFQLSLFFFQLNIDLGIPLLKEYGLNIHGTPSVLTFLISIYLLRSTRGIYTRWLALILLLGSLGLFYLAQPELANKFLKEKNIQIPKIPAGKNA